MYNEALVPLAESSVQTALPFVFQREIMTFSENVPRTLMTPPAVARMETPFVIFTFEPAAIVRTMFVGTMTFDWTMIIPMAGVQVVFSVSVPPTNVDATGVADERLEAIFE